MQIIVSIKAHQDIDDIINYFESKKLEEVAIDFLINFKEIKNLLILHPEIGSQRFCGILNDDSIRYFILKKFDYYIFYKIIERQIVIVRVLSSKRYIFRIFK